MTDHKIIPNKLALIAVVGLLAGVFLLLFGWRIGEPSFWVSCIGAILCGGSVTTLGVWIAESAGSPQ